MAHEINNPLAYVMLNLELLDGRLRRLDAVEPDLMAQMMRGVEDARDGAERMRRIVRALGAFGRGDEDRLGPVDVNGVLDSAAELAAMQLRHRARLTRRYEALGPARANPFRLGQVFLNLLVNAADALREDGPDNEIVLLTRTRVDGFVIVEVQDNGAGVPAELQSRIFDPFFTTKPVGKGTGLGLAVCHAIVTSFGGQIACESAPGRGATFRVTLPPARPESATSPREPGAGAIATTFTAARGRVLVADDDARVALALARTLEDHEVVVVSSGRDALDRCRTEPFDCILRDVMMPDVSGVDVHEALRHDGLGVERTDHLRDGRRRDRRRANGAVSRRQPGAGEAHRHDRAAQRGRGCDCRGGAPMTLRKPRLTPQVTTLWDFPSQHYDESDRGGSREQGSQGYKGATPSYVIWNVIQRFSAEGEKVLDPFCGSGTTLDVCKDTGREGLGFDWRPRGPTSARPTRGACPLKSKSVDLVFMDPPYADNLDVLRRSALHRQAQG